MKSLTYAIRRALARLGLAAKPAPPPVATLAGGPHLTTLANAVRLSADREDAVAAVLTPAEAAPRETYRNALRAAAGLLAELAKAAAAGDARP